jgi:hypothetical protein
VAVLDGRPTIENEIRAAPSEIRIFVAGEMARHLANPAFTEFLPGHLANDVASQDRLPGLLEKMWRIAKY